MARKSISIELQHDRAEGPTIVIRGLFDDEASRTFATAEEADNIMAGLLRLMLDIATWPNLQEVKIHIRRVPALVGATL